MVPSEETARPVTVLSAVGAHGSRAPLLVAKAARRVRGVLRAEVNEPPAYTVVGVTARAFTAALAVGVQLPRRGKPVLALVEKAARWVRVLPSTLRKVPPTYRTVPSGETASTLGRASRVWLKPAISSPVLASKAAR